MGAKRGYEPGLPIFAGWGYDSDGEKKELVSELEYTVILDI